MKRYQMKIQLLRLQWGKVSDEIIYDVTKISKNIPTVITKRSII